MTQPPDEKYNYLNAMAPGAQPHEPGALRNAMQDGLAGLFPAYSPTVSSQVPGSPYDRYMAAAKASIPPERPRWVVNALFSAIDSLSPTAAIAARWVLLSGAFPTALRKVPEQVVVGNAPPVLGMSAYARRMLTKVVNNGGINEIFIVQMAATYIIQAARETFPDQFEEIAHALFPFADREQLLKRWVDPL